MLIRLIVWIWSEYFPSPRFIRILAARHWYEWNRVSFREDIETRVLYIRALCDMNRILLKPQ